MVLAGRRRRVASPRYLACCIPRISVHCTHVGPICCPGRLEHVGEALAAAQKAASKDVSAAAISLLESPPADLWLRLTMVSRQAPP